MTAIRFNKGEKVPQNILTCDYAGANIRFNQDVLVEYDENGHATVYPDDENFKGCVYDSTGQLNALVRVDGIPSRSRAVIDGNWTTWHVRPKGYDYRQEYETVTLS